MLSASGWAVNWSRGKRSEENAEASGSIESLVAQKSVGIAGGVILGMSGAAISAAAGPLSIATACLGLIQIPAGGKNSVEPATASKGAELNWLSLCQQT